MDTPTRILTSVGRLVGLLGKETFLDRKKNHISLNRRSMKMSSTNKERYLTTGEDIKNLLARCKKCNSITDGGKNIVFHAELPNLNIAMKNKVAVIVNTADGEQVGHWFLLTCFRNLKTANAKCFIVDTLGQVKKEPNIMKNVKLFCRNNHFTLLNYNLKIQRSDSLACGYLVLFFLFKFSIMSLNEFLSLKRVMTRQSINTNEKIALKATKNHFRINSL